MKVGILTFHFVNNFGGALQAYALKHSCEECGAEAHLVDYRQWFIRFTDMIRLFPITRKIKVLRSGMKTMPDRLRRRAKFQAFQKDFFSLSRKYNSSHSIKHNLPGYDKYICGSDQIWNAFITCGVPRAYYLFFEKESRNKFAYAPSFGSSSVKSKNAGKTAKYLSELGDISVREKEGVAIVEQLIGKKVPQLIDPTFLVSRGDWEALADTINYSLPYKEYILVYIMQDAEIVHDYATKLKEKLGIPIVEIARYGYKDPNVDKCLVDVGPLEFLNLFRGATHICTNSYHGIIFSIIFRKHMCIIPCKRFKSRIDSLADLFGIEIKTDIKQLDLDVKYIMDTVETVISEEKNKAFSYLRKNLFEND